MRYVLLLLLASFACPSFGFARDNNALLIYLLVKNGTIRVCESKNDCNSGEVCYFPYGRDGYNGYCILDPRPKEMQREAD